MRTPRSLTLTLLAALLVGGCQPVTSTPSGGDTPGATTKADGGSEAALASLETLTVAKSRPMTGYSRNRFSHWNRAGKNCDVRDTVLARDGEDVKLDGCNVTGGTWFSVYDGLTFTDPLKVDIDHMVPLANAWRSGADKWADEQRSAFANDLDRPQLFAVSASSNRSKGDQDPSLWKPPSKSYWCQYAQDWITVKAYWKLTVTENEKDALTDMLASCA